MKNSTERINELTELVNNAFTPDVEGRQSVVNACKELYNMIEDDVYRADKEWMLKGMYTDLCTGNFAEPFMCEQKKLTFNTIVEIYKTRVVPFL